MVAIRMTRLGSKKRPFYRIIAIDKEKPRNSAFLDLLGYYNPLTNPVTFKIDLKKYQDWLKKGAQPSDIVKALVKKLNTEK